MRREIKFRGKRIDNGEWVYGSLVIYPSCKGEWTKSSEIWNFDSKGEHYWVVIPETFGQFTGLKDKNGVEIYEGDVVRYETDYDLMRFEVKWNKDTLMWEATSQAIVDEPLYYKNGFIEIIGNIHDNPELIANLE